MSENKFGLSRTIPTSVKREVRRRCGYGCVICGNGIYQYEHFNPVFSEAKEHNADGITLLCGYCHDRKTRKQFSIEKVIEANNSPKCFEKNYTSFTLDLGEEVPVVRIGSNLFENPEVVLEVNGKSIFSFTKDSESQTCLMNFNFFDKDGNLICKIENNELISNIGKLDIEAIGTKISFYNLKKEAVLLLDYLPRKELLIKKAHMKIEQTELYIDDDNSIIRSGSANANFSNSVFTNCKVGLKTNENGLSMGHQCSSCRIGSAVFDQK